MGTRGCWGFRLEGQDKLTYNHWDSYPVSLGTALTDTLAKYGSTDWDILADEVSDLVLVDERSTPTPEQIDRLRQYADEGVGGRSLNDWYCLLRRSQGDMEKTLESKLMVDSHKFMRDSLFCEWAYVINLDDDLFEIYRGFQKEPHTKGRYSGFAPDQGYYPVALFKTYPLDDIPENWAEVTEKEVYSDEGDDE
jgi:hypothetical protein